MSHKEYELTNQDTHSLPERNIEHLEVQESKTNQTPLHFTCRINGDYYISYKKGQFKFIMARSVIWAIINIFINSVVQSYSNISDTIKDIVEIGLILQIVLHLMVSLLDPGTLFQDEYFCKICKIYKLRSSHHCIWCNRCTKWYDHHCSVFAKCIGKRNCVFFWVFVFVCGCEFPGLIVITVLNLMQLS